MRTRRISKGSPHNARQLVSVFASTRPIWPVSLEQCVDEEWLPLVIKLGVVDVVKSYNDLTNEQFPTYLDGKDAESEKVATMDNINKTVETKLMTGTHYADDKLRIESSFALHVTILRMEDPLQRIYQERESCCRPRSYHCSTYIVA